VFNPRPGQAEVLRFAGGKMGISAVPGSGKTHTLSALAAQLVASEDLAEDQEILIVTLVNSAVDNFASRVAGFLRTMNLMPGIGYRVRTLHGLSYDIVREMPSLAGLDNQFAIADERTSAEILNLSVSNWMRIHPEFLEEYSDVNFPPEDNGYRWTDALISLAGNFIRQAKDYQVMPDSIHSGMEKLGIQNPLLNFGYQIYADYQRALALRGAVDFEDLIRLAYQVLRRNPEYLNRLQHRWSVILEDEAQDSSLIQEKLLRLLCGETGSWVRVGDPNQAIFETFTTADPELLRAFILEEDVVPVDLEHSGRSTCSIISLANRLIEWTRDDHPVVELRDTLSEPFILPTLPGDAQPNPEDEPSEIYLFDKALKAEEEITIVAGSIQRWLVENPDRTVAVLVPRNIRGSELAEELIKRKVPVREMLNSSQETRDTARNLRDILKFYVNPSSSPQFVDALKAVFLMHPENNARDELSPDIVKWIRNQRNIENIIGQKGVSMESLHQEFDDSKQINRLQSALNLLRNWQGASLLPIDQMIMTIAMELLSDPAQLALAHKLAVILKNAQGLDPSMELPDFVRELDEIARNRFKLYGFSSDDLGFDPEEHKGEVVISTIHKAKGLEWDRVYLMSVNNYDFPSLQEHDQYMSERWFVRDSMNLEAELLSKLEALVKEDITGLFVNEGVAGEKARLDYCAERLRLLYVGITRAKRQLVVTWNTGRREDCTEALPLRALREWREENHALG
jgi:DNA helicase-2/ATP-dependent DNA helicase PcrA